MPTTSDDIGIFVQTTDGYLDLFLPGGDRWTRSDNSVYVYGDDDETVAEVEDEHFVSACNATQEMLTDINTTTDDAEVSPE